MALKARSMKVESTLRLPVPADWPDSLVFRYSGIRQGPVPSPFPNSA